MWDICPRGGTTKQLATFLTENAHDFVHQGEPVTAAADPMVQLNPIFTHKFMLVERHRQLLLAQQGVEMWHFEQHRGEAVFIPGGCPHQVRNLQSCSKVRIAVNSLRLLLITAKMVAGVVTVAACSLSGPACDALCPGSAASCALVVVAMLLDEVASRR